MELYLKSYLTINSTELSRKVLLSAVTYTADYRKCDCKML